MRVSRACELGVRLVLGAAASHKHTQTQAHAVV